MFCEVQIEMAVMEALLKFSSTGTLLGALLLLLVIFLLCSDSKYQKEGKEPPGPKPLPLLGNLLMLDLKRPFDTLCEVRLTDISTLTESFTDGHFNIN